MTLLLVLLFGVGCAIAAGAWVYDICVTAAQEVVADAFDPSAPRDPGHRGQF